MEQSEENKVHSGQEKYLTYQFMMKRHKLAMKNQFYFEAVLIDYAMLEDRLLSFLWACGAVNAVDSKRIGLGSKHNKHMLMEIYTAFSKNTNPPQLKKISMKIEVCRALLDFARQEYHGEERYLKALHAGLCELDIENLQTTLKQIEEWKDYRNALIHALMNHKVEVFSENLEEFAQNGLDYVRVIDRASQKLKRRKSIRLSARLSIKKF